MLHASDCQMLLRKEVIQPHLPVRRPCYDFTPIADPTFDGSLLAVGPPASGVTDFRGVTGGVYKARERIHRSIADSRLLATPTSRGRADDSHAPPVRAPKSSGFHRIYPACQAQVRFFALRRIKPHAPPLVRAPVNSFEF